MDLTLGVLGKLVVTVGEPSVLKEVNSSFEIFLPSRAERGEEGGEGGIVGEEGVAGGGDAATVTFRLTPLRRSYRFCGGCVLGTVAVTDGGRLVGFGLGFSEGGGGRAAPIEGGGEEGGGRRAAATEGGGGRAAATEGGGGGGRC